jgi:hypothetical protein
MTLKVFISAATKGTARQNQAKETVFNTLRNAGLNPRQMNKNEWSFQQPLKAIRKVIAECHGIAVLAFSQYAIQSCAEVADQGQEPRPTEFCLPTVWNQIEAAMAYTRDLPLFIIAEKGVKEEGLMEGYDWTVYWTDLDPADFQSEKFLGYLKSWKDAVAEHAVSVEKATPDFDLLKLPLAKSSAARRFRRLGPLCLR